MKKEQEKSTKDKEQSGEVSRRDFLIGAGTVVVGSTVGAGLLSSCTKGEATTVTTTKTVEKTTTIDGNGAASTVTETKTVGGDGAITITETKTITEGNPDSSVTPALEPEESYVNKSGFCLGAIAVDAKKGKVVRCRPIHYDWTYPDLKPFTLTARGMTYNFSADSAPAAYMIAYKKPRERPSRILYPLKRVDWEPGGDPAKINAQNRGISKYKRISWDEATTIVADELKRVADTYGTQSITPAYGGGMCEDWGLLSGYTQPPTYFMQHWAINTYGTPVLDEHGIMYSQTGGMCGGRYVWGMNYEGFPLGMWRQILDNTEMILVWGGDPISTSWYHSQFTGKIFDFYRELGIKQIYINPDLNRAAGLLGDKWIEVLPGTDCAVMMAIAYLWIQEENYAKDYIETHALGFEKWEAYVTGEEDGIPKTPEWASSHSGVPEWTIKALARAWASKITSLTHGGYGGGMGRGPYAHEANRMELYLLAMQGLGQPGRYQFTINGLPNFPGPLSTYFVAPISDVSLSLQSLIKDNGVRLTQGDTNRGFFSRHLMGECIMNPPVYWWDYNAANF